MLFTQHLITALQVIHLDFALREGHVRNRVNEFAGISQDAVVELVGPELARLLKLLIDRNRFRNINAAVLFRRVVELTQSGVTGTGIIPRGGGFQGGTVKALKDHLGPARLQLAEHSAQGGTHDAGTYQRDIDLIYNLCCLLC